MTYKCSESHCKRIFSKFDSYRKHREREHIKPNLSSEILPPSSCHIEKNVPTQVSTEKSICYDNINSLDNVAGVSNECINFSNSDDKLKSRSVNSNNSLELLKSENVKLFAKLYQIYQRNVPFVNLLRDTVLDRLNELNKNSEEKIKIKQLFDTLQNPFHEFRSTYRSLEILRSIGTFIRADHINIGVRDEYRIEQHYWKSRVQSDERTILPVAIFFDDYENNNPLGRHRNIKKCGALYLSIMCLPPKYRSKLSNIFLLFLVNTLDRKLIQKSVLFEKVIEELAFLENVGITVECNGEEKQIYFRLATILGDNLGIHELLGLTLSFNSTYFCRFWLVKKNDIHNILSEKSCIMRNRENISVDINELINGFSYSYHDKSNKPPPILMEHLKNEHIIMSAAEMLSLVRNLSVIIGHLIPNDLEVWQLVTRLTGITNIVTAKFYQYDHCDYLDVIIQEYLWFLCELFPGSMKPKHHFLLHYSSVMKSS
ncbi:uncharacterized protein [Chelonus insularis]|uniref:uncharacterized protein n=1 Tax=Chelonus insularis TaxID=460826 RepID=UPI00158DB841|nr:uncharacterized protein LOC118070068 [Chelonus insularis]